MDLRLAVLHAKMWALELINNAGIEHVRLSIDVKSFDKTTRIMLAPANQSFKTTTLHDIFSFSTIKDHWWTDIVDNKLIYTLITDPSYEKVPPIDLELVIHEDIYSLYAFICKEYNRKLEMHWPVCLVFWQKENLSVRNQGYGPGRFERGTRVI